MDNEFQIRIAMCSNESIACYLMYICNLAFPDMKVSGKKNKLALCFKVIHLLYSLALPLKFKIKFDKVQVKQSESLEIKILELIN